MLKIHSEPTPPPPTATGAALFALGFRPFFSVAAIAAAILITVWLGGWTGGIPLPNYYGAIGWHNHEMLFGYAAAVIAGFLLTAVRNWTGVNTPSGLPLIVLTLIWLAGRIAPFFTPLPATLIATIDLIFLPSVAIAITGPLWRGKQKINRIFVPILLLMAVANLLVHIQSLGIANTATQGTDMMLYLVIMLITILGGRVMPFFTQAVIPQSTAQRWQSVETVAMIAIIGFILTQLLYPAMWLTIILAAIVAASQAIRVYGWYHRDIWSIPLLWILYSAFFWVVIGFSMLALASAGLVGVTMAKHALTVGGIGIATFGMMARVALGHTARPLEPHRLITASFILLNLTALLRVFGPILLPAKQNLWVHASGGLWIISFLLFIAIYLPILWQPRLDGKPG